MPVGLKFQRKHRFLGYKLKYIYYFIARRNILQKKKSYGKCNADKVIYIIKPDYQDGVEGLTQGSKFSYALNGGKYVDEYVFDLGLYD